MAVLINNCVHVCRRCCLQRAFACANHVFGYLLQAVDWLKLEKAKLDQGAAELRDHQRHMLRSVEAAASEAHQQRLRQEVEAHAVWNAQNDQMQQNLMALQAQVETQRMALIDFELQQKVPSSKPLPLHLKSAAMSPGAPHEH